MPPSTPLVMEMRHDDSGSTSSGNNALTGFRRRGSTNLRVGDEDEDGRALVAPMLEMRFNDNSGWQRSFSCLP
ncbi:hypothetical protein DEO72_LG7g1287 [Vigna unguiculata]|uniref:Uncharacterized protein n=1 Tax=Vigna unguiculata TaxID=3917 RepID=A0A4D6MGY7_VIGUN|nr:hypothetical protein DEO72_LG7g1287 [Vigna unguiculata]